MREVFITKRRNRGGRKYEFVRFKGEDNVGRLEHQLDNMIIEGLKLHVNRPEHEREPTKKGESTIDVKHKVGIDHTFWNGGPLKQPQHPCRIQAPISYATVVVKGSNTMERRWFPRHAIPARPISRSTM